MSQSGYRELLVHAGPLRASPSFRPVTRVVGRLRFADSSYSALFQYSNDWIWGLEHEPQNFFAIDPRLKPIRGAWQPLGFSGFLLDVHPSPANYRLIEASDLPGSKPLRPSYLSPSDTRSMGGFLADIYKMPDEVRLGALSFSDATTGKSVADPLGWVPNPLQLRKARSDTRRALSSFKRDEKSKLQIKLPVTTYLPGYDYNAQVFGKDTLTGPITCVFPFGGGGFERGDTSWIAAQLAMADHAGIEVAFKGAIDGRAQSPTLIFSRFDRDGLFKIPFISAATLLGIRPQERTSFLAIADMIRSWPDHFNHDLEQLWRRAVFGCLVDILSTAHTIGFLWRSGTWRLAPMWHAEMPGGVSRMAQDREERWIERTEALDMNSLSPPLSIRPKLRHPRLEDALQAAANFGLELDLAQKIAGEIGVQVMAWRNQAKIYGVPAHFIRLFNSTFQTPDLTLACSFATPSERIRKRGRGRG